MNFKEFSIRFLSSVTDTNNDTGLNLGLKILSIILILSITIMFGFFPFFCKRCKNSVRILGVANAFSGGIFLGIALFHLLPESGENFEKLDENNFMKKFPFPFFLAFITYAFILFIEKIAFNSHALIEHDHEDHEHQQKKSTNKKDMNELLLGHDKKNENKTSSDDSSDEDEDVIKNAITSRGKFATFLYMRNSIIDPSKPLKTDKSLQRASMILTKTFQKSFDYNLNDDMNFMVNPKNVVNVNEKDEIGPLKSEHKHEQFKPKSNLTPFLLLIALSMHGFFEGVALGIQNNVKGSIFLAIAILAHKWAEAFTLGVSFNKANTDKSLFVKLIIIFSLFTPVGIILGIVLNNLESKVLEGIVLAMSSGTFIYVAGSEVIVEEFAVTKYKFQKFFAYLVGGILVAGLSLMEKLTE